MCLGDVKEPRRPSPKSFLQIAHPPGPLQLISDLRFWKDRPGLLFPILLTKYSLKPRYYIKTQEDLERWREEGKRAEDLGSIWPEVEVWPSQLIKIESTKQTFILH